MFDVSSELLESIKKAIIPEMNFAGQCNSRVYHAYCSTCQNTCKGTCRNKCDRVGKGIRR